MRVRVRAVGLAGAMAAVTIAITAVGGAGGASTGTLTPRGCIDDNDPPEGPDDCGDDADGLDEPDGVAVSPNGRSVYVVSGGDDAIVRFHRSASGALTPRGCIDDNDPPAGPDNCADDTNGLDGAGSVAVSADGNSVYVASDQDDDAIARFDRSASGKLTPRGCIDDNDPPDGPDNCATDANGLDDASSVAVSRDGRSVYAATEGDNAIVHFKRNGRTGALTPRGCIDDNDDGPDNCADDTNGLNGAGAVAVSPDGKSVYVIGENDDAIVTFKRSSRTGKLTPRGCIEDNDPPAGPDDCGDDANGLSRVGSVAVSPDGTSVYVTGEDDDAIVTFKRNSRTGKLTPRGCIEDNDPPEGPDDCAADTNGLEGASSVAVSQDGKSVYVTSEDDDAITLFKRNKRSGKLTPQGCIEDNDPPEGPDDCGDGTNGLDSTEGVTVSPDGKSVYVTSEGDDAIVHFRRQR